MGWNISIEMIENYWDVGMRKIAFLTFRLLACFEKMRNHRRKDRRIEEQHENGNEGRFWLF